VRQSVWHVWEKEEVNKVFCRGNLRERDCLTNLSADGRIILKCILKKLAGMAWMM
jgi:hypothetical protein